MTPILAILAWLAIPSIAYLLYKVQCAIEQDNR